VVEDLLDDVLGDVFIDQGGPGGYLYLILKNAW